MEFYIAIKNEMLLLYTSVKKTHKSKGEINKTDSEENTL